MNSRRGVQLHRNKEGLHNGSLLVSFTNLFRIAFQQNSSVRLLLKFCEIREHWCSPTFLILRKHYTRVIYLIIFDRVDKLPRKNRYLKKILDFDYEFGLRYILLDLNYWKSYGQRFIITLITYFTGVGFENIWTIYKFELELLYFTGSGL